MGAQEAKLRDTLVFLRILLLGERLRPAQGVVHATHAHVMHPPKIVEVAGRRRLHIDECLPKVALGVVARARRAFVSLAAAQRAFLVRHPELLVKVILPAERVRGDNHLLHLIDRVQVAVGYNSLRILVQYR